MDPFRPQNELETVLVAAGTDEAARPRFYETLLKSHVLVAPEGEMPRTVGGEVPEATNLSFRMVEINGQPHVPFFSSEARLPEGVAFFGLSAIDFLRMTEGSTLVLNPGSSYGKVFLPTEVASLLDGSLFRPEVLTAKGGEKQLIGQPKDYPHQFASAVARLLASEPGVERAFLAQHFIEGMHTQPAILVAVVAPEAGFERIAGAIGVIAKETRKTRGAVDVTRIDGSGLGYFSNVKPIYERKTKSLFAKLFG